MVRGAVREKDRRSQDAKSSVRAPAKKDGGGGKFTFGRAGENYGGATVDERDPNYDPDERRTDPDDGTAYKYDELAAFYKGKFTAQQVAEYWEYECTVKPQKGKAKQAKQAAPTGPTLEESAAQAKSKPKGKGKGESAVSAKPKFKVKTREPAAADDVIQKVTDCKVIPVIKLEDAAHAVPLAKALKEGGINVVEITFRSACAAEAIREACTVEGVCVGAGTVLKPEQVDQAVNNGADFVVSPGFDPAVANRCRDLKVLYLPGVVTPSEVMMVTSKYKLKVLKFFPASNFGGAGTLKSYSAVFQDVSFMPTGGVTEANISDFVSLPNVVAAGGSWMVADAAIKKAAASGDWSDIAAGARKASEAAKAGASKK